MAILQFFQVSNIASHHQKLYLAKEQNSEPEQTGINAEQGKPSEEHVFRCMGALSTFCAINREVGIQYHHCIVIVIIIHIRIFVKNINNKPTNHCDPQVPQLVKMIGPDPNKFSGLSTRVDEQLGRHHRHLHHQCPQIHVQLLWHHPIIIMFIVQLLWRLGWRTSRCSDTSSPISSMSGLSHRTLVRGATGAFGKRRMIKLFFM